MAKVSAHGSIIGTWFSPRRGYLMRAMSDGVVLKRYPGGTWKILGRFPREKYATVEEWVSKVRSNYIEKGMWWCMEVSSLPSARTLEEWSLDGGCESPTGHWVEPDGNGPDGVPSWLRVLRMI